MKNPLLIFLQFASCRKDPVIKCMLMLIISVVLISCSKEYSCEVNCRIGQQAITDSGTAQTDTLLPVKYNYYSASFHVALAGTGNNQWGYTIPAFDTATGILDTLEINMFTTLAYYFALQNSSSSGNSYSIGILRKDSLSSDSITLINHNYNFSYGPQSVPGLSTYQDSLSVLNNVELTSIVTSHLDKFTGDKYVAFDYTPYSSSFVMGASYNLDDSFHDSTYILSTYYYKKKI